MPLYRSPNRRQHTALPPWRRSAGVKAVFFFLSIYFALLTRGSISGIFPSFSLTV